MKEALHPAFRRASTPTRKAHREVDTSEAFPSEEALPPPIAAIQHEPLPGRKVRIFVQLLSFEQGVR